MTKKEKTHAMIFIEKWCVENKQEAFIPKHIAFELIEKLETGFWKGLPPPMAYGEFLKFGKEK